MTEDVTRDAFLGGRLHLLQPAQGYRAGVDAVLLASACPAWPGQRVLELGCGVGTAVLCLATRVAGLKLTGVERNAEAADLARRNSAEAGHDVQIVTADLAALPHEVRQLRYDHVIANPPYFLRDSTIASAHAQREAAMGEETPLDTWLDVASRRLAPRGWLTLIQRAERLGDVLARLDGRLGSVAIQPLAPRANRAARLVLVRAQKGGRAPLTLHAPIVLHAGTRHEADGDDYTEEVSQVLRGGKALPGFSD